MDTYVLDVCAALHNIDYEGKLNCNMDTYVLDVCATLDNTDLFESQLRLGRSWFEPGSKLGRTWVNISHLGQLGSTTCENQIKLGRTWVELGSILGAISKQAH